MAEDLLKRIEENLSSFSKSQKSIATYILNHYEKAAFLTAARLGEITGVSESTIVRFATEMGFAGYPEFKNALKGLIPNHLTSVQRVEVTNDIIGDSNALEAVMNADIDRIRHTLENIDRNAFEKACDKLVKARHIYILGVRSSAVLSSFIEYYFRFIFDNIKFVQTTSGSEIFEQMLTMDKNDVLLAISFPRYSKRVVRAVDFAHTRGANVISLTDSYESPIAKNADEVLTAHSDMASFVDTLVAPMSVINAMVVELTRRKSEEVSSRLRQLEEIWDVYDVYAKRGE